MICIVYHACILYDYLGYIYIDTNISVSVCMLGVVSSRHPQSVISAEPLHDAHRS